jgi:hypothetical protein
LSSTNSASVSDIAPTNPPPIPSLDTISSTHPSVQAHTYIWIDYLENLKPKIWDFADFIRTNAHKWVGEGPEAQDNKFYGEVDKRRDMGGIIIHRGIVGTEGEDTEQTRVIVEAEVA